jgi:hypothetical protein
MLRTDTVPCQVTFVTGQVRQINLFQLKFQSEQGYQKYLELKRLAREYSYFTQKLAVWKAGFGAEIGIWLGIRQALGSQSS